MAFNLFLVVPVLIGYTPGQSNFSYSQLFTNLYADHEDRIWNLNDMAVLCFPRIFHCIEKKYGPSGTTEITAIYCTNQLASWVEAFFICNLFILGLLAIIWVLDVTCTTLYLFFCPLQS